ncbi:hypothetical protein E4T38_04471 [Aureobasidium subglaciale]|nr:hypothetical protein E4T38_04471 [Aureobasidium subglaciale]KAI5223876.1 hypothetical protein E4T40_04247 [Aureobasidium subglaciale]KAI5227384.1 hypothetical protein E4T41_04329 [Aureobasidium subglaciale]KAI5262768.1 hypothetical protein E4T46_04215 [Aureobasidium subglaciale]
MSASIENLKSFETPSPSASSDGGGQAPTDTATLGHHPLTRVTRTDPFAEADEDTGEIKQSNQSSYIHIRIQRTSLHSFHHLTVLGNKAVAGYTEKRRERNGRKTLTTVQGLPKKFDQKKILKVIKKAFACNGTIVSDTEMGEVIQLQGDQRKDVQEFLCDKKAGLGLDAKTIKVHGF